MKRLISVVAIVVASPLAYGWETPAKAMSEFLTFETDGGRISSENMGRYTDYIAVPEDYEEPGWDEVTVIESYKVLGIKCPSSKKCQGMVEFVLTPTKNLRGPSVVEHSIGGKELKTYVVQKHAESWLLEPGFGSPVITIQTYNSHKAKYGL